MKDPKSQLQEIIQKNYQSLPKYFVKEISNSSIEAKFEATCSVKEANLKSKGEGKTRKRYGIRSCGYNASVIEKQ